jgi:hypothetical protein
MREKGQSGRTMILLHGLESAKITQAWRWP